MTIAKNIQGIKSQLPESVNLIAVSKTRPVEDILEAYHAGQRDFGENRVQELIQKAPLLPADIRWHLIGHLQSNKVKQVLPYVSLVHSVDSMSLLAEINKEAAKINKIIPCLLEFHIAREESKFGLKKDEFFQSISRDSFDQFKNVEILGVMGMATFTEDEGIVREEFRLLKRIFSRLKTDYFPYPGFRELSMGMSDDYPIAMEEGSTMIRIGTAIFGSR
jgi:hypothetical protein